jgi:intraflagellar transport protein 88
MRRPGTAAGPRGATARAGTSSGASDGVRPMTSVKGAGFQSKPPGTGRAGGGGVDLSTAKATGPAPPLAEKTENGPEDQAKDLEKKVHGLVEASAEAQARGDAVMALERAKEAARKERALCKFRESNGLGDGINMDLTYSVCFGLASAYHTNKMYQEAINTYSLIVKNKQYAQGGRLRVNMGNIYFEEGKFAAAVKMYRMALDQVPATSKELRTRIQRNIGTAFVRLGQYQDAIQAFESIMDSMPEFQAGFNLVVCYFALGDVDLMKKGFQRLLTVELPIREGEEDDEGKTDDDDDNGNSSKLELSRDALKEELTQRQKDALAYVTNASKLIAPAIEPGDWAAGYDWVIEQLRIDHMSVASELQISKALQYLKDKNFERAIEELKAFEKKDVHLKARAATNLSFLYFLEGDMGQASKYANLAVRHDRYNAKALVNMGNCLMDRGELERAKELYLEAIGVEADCVEAIFNLGLVNKLLGALGEALQAFEKLHTLVPASPEVLYQIAMLHDMLGHPDASIKYFSYLLSKVRHTRCLSISLCLSLSRSVMRSSH